MDEKEIKQIINTGRKFMANWHEFDDSDYQSDQNLKLPQPPLTKAAVSDVIIDLPHNFNDLSLINNTIDLFTQRKSSRVYTQEKISLLQLSWLLWATQGVKGIRGKSYATLRTVPCGGARHEFECYMIIQNVTSLQDGCYHYLPMTHQLELLSSKEDIETKLNASLKDIIGKTLNGQIWASKANVVFYYSMVSYRAEWRYGIYAHRVALIDAGHITENLYLACCANNLGTCAIGAVDGKLCDKIFNLDGDEEFCFYSATVGTIKKEDKAKEDAFYAFVQKDNL